MVDLPWSWVAETGIVLIFVNCIIEAVLQHKRFIASEVADDDGGSEETARGETQEVGG